MHLLWIRYGRVGEMTEMYDYSRHSTSELLTMIKSKSNTLSVLLEDKQMMAFNQSQMVEICDQIHRIGVVLSSREAQLPLWKAQ